MIIKLSYCKTWYGNMASNRTLNAHGD